MNHPKSDWLMNFQDWSTNKSDRYLAEVIQGDDPEKVDLALRILQDRYNGQLRGFLFQALPSNLIDDVYQVIWEQIYIYLRINKLKYETLGPLLMNIARKKRATAVDDNAHEKKIDTQAIPMRNIGEAEIETVEKPIDVYIEDEKIAALRGEQSEFLSQVPYIQSFLTPCERVFWILTYEFEFPIKIVAKLTCNREGNIYQALYRARSKTQNLVKSEEFDLRIALQEQNNIIPSSLQSPPNITVECFMKPRFPRLTPKEMYYLQFMEDKYFYITPKEFETFFHAFLILPGSHLEAQLMKPCKVIYMLVERPGQLPHERRHNAYDKTQLWAASLATDKKSIGLTHEADLLITDLSYTWYRRSFLNEMHGIDITLSFHNERSKLPIFVKEMYGTDILLYINNQKGKLTAGEKLQERARDVHRDGAKQLYPGLWNRTIDLLYQSSIATDRIDALFEKEFDDDLE